MGFELSQCASDPAAALEALVFDLQLVTPAMRATVSSSGPMDRILICTPRSFVRPHVGALEESYEHIAKVSSKRSFFFNS
jgi:hypothetical protein